MPSPNRRREFRNSYVRLRKLEWRPHQPGDGRGVRLGLAGFDRAFHGHRRHADRRRRRGLHRRQFQPQQRRHRHHRRRHCRVRRCARSGLHLQRSGHARTGPKAGAGAALTGFGTNNVAPTFWRIATLFVLLGGAGLCGTVISALSVPSRHTSAGLDRIVNTTHDWVIPHRDSTDFFMRRSGFIAVTAN